MTEPSDTHRRNRYCIYSLSATLILLVFILVAVILGFTLFRPRDPAILILSTRVTGVLPSVDFPAFAFQLNATLDLAIRAYNPNRAAFVHALGRTELYYKGAMVGDGDVEPGWVSPMGDEDLAAVLTLQSDRFSSELVSLAADVLAGEVEFDATTWIPGRVVFLGFTMWHHAVVSSQCHVAIGFPDLNIKQQHCTQKLKL